MAGSEDVPYQGVNDDPFLASTAPPSPTDAHVKCGGWPEVPSMPGWSARAGAPANDSAGAPHPPGHNPNISGVTPISPGSPCSPFPRGAARSWARQLTSADGAKKATDGADDREQSRGHAREPQHRHCLTRLALVSRRSGWRAPHLQSAAAENRIGPTK